MANVKVRELIKKLQQFDQDLEVLCYIEEEEEIIKKGHRFRLLQINDLATTEGDKIRGDDGIPSIKFGKTDHSEKIVTIDITSIF